MPILKLQDTSLTTQCAACSVSHVLDMASLELGTQINPDVIQLPTCTCGAAEFLTRVWDVHPEFDADSFRDRHRRAVNTLGLMLKQRGQTHEAWVDRYQSEGSTPDMATLVDGKYSVR